MRIVLVTGGARSGKSRHAEEIARETGGDHVTVVATARRSDPEMNRRIEVHRRSRPPSWSTVEAPLNPATAIGSAATGVVLLDCLTLLVSNAILEIGAIEEEEATRAAGAAEAGAAEGAVSAVGETAALEAADAAVARVLGVADDREGTLIVVTNEVGMGLVPATPLGRWFRDAQGRANQAVARAADRVVLMVSGLPLVVKDR